MSEIEISGSGSGVEGDEMRIKDLIKEDLINNITKFINELDLCFDYISQDTLSKLKVFCNDIKNDEKLKSFSENAILILDKNKENITFIVTTKGKLKGLHFDFLNHLILFDDILNFSVFKDENKNTKKTIVNYLNNIYMSLVILEKGINEAERNFKNIVSFLKIKMQDIEEKEEKEKEKEENTQKKIIQKEILDDTYNNLNEKFKNFDLFGNKDATFNLQSITEDLKQTADGLVDLDRGLNFFNPQNNGEDFNIPNNQFGNVIKTLIQNKEIMSIASELTNDIQKENIDPLSLLTSMISGKQDSNLQNLIKNISTKLDDKINSGKINKEELEKDAEVLLKNFKMPKDEPVD